MQTNHDRPVPGALTAIDAMIMQRIPPRTQFIYAHAAIRDARLIRYIMRERMVLPRRDIGMMQRQRDWYLLPGAV